MSGGGAVADGGGDEILRVCMGKAMPAMGGLSVIGGKSLWQKDGVETNGFSRLHRTVVGGVDG